MTKRYTGGVVSSSLPTVNAAGASGVFNLSQQSDYQSRNAWPPYKIEESLRFRASATGYLNRTPVSAGNRRTWTWSGWVKRSNIGTNGVMLGTETVNSQTYCSVYFVSDKIYLDAAASNIETMRVYTDAVFRDPSAWYHVVAVFDSTQATATNRRAIYVNGVLQTLTVSTNPAQNLEPLVNSTVEHNIGRNPLNLQYFDGYMTEINFIDGQALTPSSFGATDKDGNWSPIAYTGTYGTNGFYLNFKDATSTSTVGYDYSGNGNNWTLNGFNVSTANTTYDIMIDVPEDQDSANNRGNYCTWNPAFVRGNETITDGNLQLATGSSGGGIGTIGVTTGKWYWESINSASTGTIRMIGVLNLSRYAGNLGENSLYWQRNGTYTLNNGSDVSYGSAAAVNDVLGIALDVDAQTVIFYNNGVALGSAISISSMHTAGQTIVPAMTQSGASNRTAVVNFGQRPWAYAPPAGYKALCTTNLPEPTIKQPNRHFDAITRNGFGSSGGSVTSLNFQPDFLWEKARSTASNNTLIDSIRGVTKELFSNLTNAESTGSNFLVSFNSNGFTMGSNDWGTSTTVVDWIWNAGGANTTNTSGSVTSIVRANPTAGFSIVTFTAPSGSTAYTVGHGLGTTPAMIIVKERSAAGNDWYVWHQGYSNTAQGNQRLNTTAVVGNSTQVWNNTAPTSTVFSSISGTAVSSSTTAVAYCFAEISGFSAFGRYTGNGSSNGAFIHTGFRPKFVMWKRTGVTNDWYMIDTSRSLYNEAINPLAANLNSQESDLGTNIDFLSNGFKARQAGNHINASGAEYIYMAFAEMPFKYARAR
jgi:hypothetical protein